MELAQRVNYAGLMGVSIGWVSHIMLPLLQEVKWSAKKPPQNLNALPLTLLKWWLEVNALRLKVRDV